MKTFICPICQKETNEFPALSRKDNKTEICSDCGTSEAMEDYYGEFVVVRIGGEIRRIHRGEIRRIHRDLKAELDLFITKANN